MSKYILLLLTFVFNFAIVVADDLPPRPQPSRLVNDLAGMLDEDEEQQLGKKLLNYSDSTSTQIAVVTVETLEGNDIADFANRLGESWGVGEKEKDNGIVILLAKEEREARIEVGYGLEGAIPDMVAKRIVDEVMVPEFKEGDFYEGIDKATDVIISKAFGEFTGEPKKAIDDIPTWLILLIVFGVFIFIFKNRNNTHSSGTYSSSGYSSGGYSSTSSSSRFGGFGGGSFGGGGASGKW